MRITLKSGDTELTLAHGSARTVSTLVNPYHVGPDRLRLAGPVALQVREFLRGSSAKASARGNVRSEVEFSVAAEFGSVQDAEYYAVLYAADVQRSGTLYLYVESAGGDRRTVKVPDAVLEDPAIEPRGVSVLIQYTITGGKAERVES